MSRAGGDAHVRRNQFLRTLAVAALGCALLAGVWVLHSDSARTPQRLYVAVSGGMLVICAAGAVLLWRHGRRRDIAIVLVVALAARLLLAFDPPRLSNDAYRFVWDGRVQAAGINPYRQPPAAANLLGLCVTFASSRMSTDRTRSPCTRRRAK